MALNALFQLPYSAISNWLLSGIPMFIFMGYVAFHAGFARDAYDTVYKWVGKLPGGLAVAPNLNLGDIFRGFLPFFLVDLFVVVGLLTLFPQITTILPSMMK